MDGRGGGLALLVGDDLEHVAHADQATLLGRIPGRGLSEGGRERLRLLRLLLLLLDELVVLRGRR